MTSLQDKLIEAIALDNQDYGDLRSWGDNHTYALLLSLEDEEAQAQLVNESYVLGLRQTYPLYQAQDRDNVELFKLLLEAGADPLKTYGPRTFQDGDREYKMHGENDALATAIFFHRVKIVEAIVEAIEDKSLLKNHLVYAKNRLASGWFTHDKKNAEEMKTIIQLLTA
jgi:hypothetical protein